MEIIFFLWLKKTFFNGKLLKQFKSSTETVSFILLRASQAFYLISWCYHIVTMLTQLDGRALWLINLNIMFHFY